MQDLPEGAAGLNDEYMKTQPVLPEETISEIMADVQEAAELPLPNMQHYGESALASSSSASEELHVDAMVIMPLLARVRSPHGSHIRRQVPERQLHAVRPLDMGPSQR